jgi:hypothetical protein
MAYINNMTQMSCNFNEQSKIVRTGGIPLWGRGASSQAKPPPTPPRQETAEFIHGFQARNWIAENGGGGGGETCKT